MNKLKITAALLFACLVYSCASTEDIAEPIISPKFTYFTDNMTTTFINSTESFGCPPENYIWDFGDDNATISFNAKHTYEHRKAYTVELTVVDCTKRKHFAVKTVPVGIPVPIVLPTFTYAADNLTVIFTNTTAITDGTIKKLLWMFGDGGISSAPTVKYTYRNYGTYNVKLVIIDSIDAESSIEQQIVISPTPPTPPAPPTPPTPPPA